MTLTTARLTLRLLNADDWPLFYTLHNDAEVIANASISPQRSSCEQSLITLKALAAKFEFTTLFSYC